MCFIPFVATRSTPPYVPVYSSSPGTQLHEVRPHVAAIVDKFSLPHCAELKLSQGCGCWLRHVDYPTAEDMDYHAQRLVESADYDPADKQDNHDDLADYLEKHFRQDGFVEFFAYFDSDAAQPARDQMEIPLSAIRHPHFHFHGGTLYRIVFDSGLPAVKAPHA